MKNILVSIAAVFTLTVFAFKPAFADDPKPLAPGVLSLDGSVGVVDKAIEDGKGTVEKALGIGISGFFDTSYTYSSNHPKNPASISGRYFDKDHNKVVFNAFNLTIEKSEKDWGVGFKIVGDFGRSGELLREATLWGSRLHQEPSAELREAFLTFTIPLGEGLQVKAGKFVTLQGTEILPVPGNPNPNISRSYSFLFAIPFTHTGALFTYPFGKVVSVSAGLATGWDNPSDNNSSPSFLGGVNFTPMDSFALASSIVVGREWIGGIGLPTFDGGTRVTWSNVATIKPVDPMTLFLEYTLGHEKGALTPVGVRDAWWHGLAGILSYDWTDRFNTAFRGEYFRDSQGARTGVNRGDLFEATATAAYKFTAKLLGRAEMRQDFADQRVFKLGGSNADRAQTTFALQAIYGF